MEHVHLLGPKGPLVTFNGNIGKGGSHHQRYLGTGRPLTIRLAVFGNLGLSVFILQPGPPRRPLLL